MNVGLRREACVKLEYISRKVADLRVSPDWPIVSSVAGDWPALANLPPRLDAPLSHKQL